MTPGHISGAPWVLRLGLLFRMTGVHSPKQSSGWICLCPEHFSRQFAVNILKLLFLAERRASYLPLAKSCFQRSALWPEVCDTERAGRRLLQTWSVQPPSSLPSITAVSSPGDAGETKTLTTKHPSESFHDSTAVWFNPSSCGSVRLAERAGRADWRSLP